MENREVAIRTGRAETRTEPEYEVVLQLRERVVVALPRLKVRNRLVGDIHIAVCNELLEDGTGVRQRNV